MSGGQYGEDELLREFFAARKVTHGYLVEVGAANGYDNSNSFMLLQSGWSGLLIEPEPQQFAVLDSFYGSRSDVVRRHCAVGSKEGKATLWCAGQVSTFIDEWKQECVRRYKLDYKPAEVQVFPLTKILDEANAPPSIQYLSVDCEGMDLAVLETLDWEKYKVDLVSVEGGTGDAFLKGLGFHPSKGTLGNRFYVRQ